MNAFFIVAETNSANSNPFVFNLFFGLLLGGMYFLFMRPRNRRMKEARALAASLAVGDEVVLTSGIFGFVSEIEDDVVWLDIADGHQQERVEIRVTRASVARKVVAPTDDTKK